MQPPLTRSRSPFSPSFCIMGHADTAVPLFKSRGKNKNLRKRAATPSDGSDSPVSYRSSEDESGHHFRRRKKTQRKKTAFVAARSNDQEVGDNDLSTTVFTADRNASLSSSNDATKQSTWHDGDPSNDMKLKPKTESAESSALDGTYKGLANQTSFIHKNPSAPDRKVGPQKAPTNVRTITIMDFAPDVCKDYKQTGFCGFGDSCKFLHAREAYKQGWQLDRDWEKVTKGKKNMQGTVVASADRRKVDHDGDDDEAILEKIPFKCIICKGDYREPVITRCGHYFCEPCALKRYRKDPTCAACSASTNGVFNLAKRLKKLLERKQDRMEQKRQTAIDTGEEVPEEGQHTTT